MNWTSMGIRRGYLRALNVQTAFPGRQLRSTGCRGFSSNFDGSAVSTKPRTLFEKVWDDHVVHKQEDGTCLIYIDRHLVHEVTSPQAFEGLRNANRPVRRVQRTLVTPDHNVSTAIDRNTANSFTDEASRIQVEELDKNAKAFQLPYFPLHDQRQGIVHIVGPEQGFSLPGLTIVCGDSHTSTHGAFGALAFGIGTSEVEHVLATQTLVQRPAKNMRIAVSGKLPVGVSSKDIILHVIGKIGTAGGTGFVIEFCGDIISSLSMEARMTMCNMAIEAGARAGMIAPDETTFNYIRGRPMSPKADSWEKAVAYWKSLVADPGAVYDVSMDVNGEDIAPQITWGTNPEMVIPVDGHVPTPESDATKRALEYMGFKGGERIEDVAIDRVFVGSCTNGRIEDLRLLASLVRGHRVHASVKQAMVVPGSGLVRRQAEEEGIAEILTTAGFEWRQPGCSMCLGMNEDQLKPFERCASTSNRNFEGRQGKQGRTHLVSPASAAAAAITGKLSDVRKVFKGQRSNLFSTSARQENLSALEPFETVKGVAAPLDMVNIDTDMIIPAIHLKTIKRSGLGKFAFSAQRYIPQESPQDLVENEAFVLNQGAYRSAKILVTGPNFGCGSSREHAPWALLDFGVRALISSSFADIFYNNCFKNGILPIVLEQATVDELMNDARQGLEMEIDLVKQTIVRENGPPVSFDVDPFRKHCLVNGLDDIGLTLQKLDKIESYEARRELAHPWF